MPTNEELRQEARDSFTDLLFLLRPESIEKLEKAIDCIIEAAVMEAVEKMEGHSHDHSHFSPSDTLFR